MIREWLLGDPEDLPSDALERPLRWGSETMRARALRVLAARGELPRRAEGYLSDPSPGVRRAAARVLATAGPLAPLRGAASIERTEEGAVALAAAQVRAGAGTEVLAGLEALDRRTLWTVGGPRQAMSTPPRPSLVERAWLILGADGVVAPVETLRRARAPDPQALAALGHPDDYPTLEAGLRTAGRRGEHTLLLALGLSGDPRALGPLRAALQAVDVDPGRGFTHRRIAAIGLGRLGFRTATPWLLRALQDEARDFEGRPGAGLGIQYPVRTDLLWALGELADPAATPALIDHLTDRQGSAFGGFYLAAMHALVKVGAPAVPAVRAVAATGTEESAAHAVSVLGALGCDLTPWRADPRPQVRRMAEVAVP